MSWGASGGWGAAPAWQQAQPVAPRQRGWDAPPQPGSNQYGGPPPQPVHQNQYGMSRTAPPKPVQQPGLTQSTAGTQIQIKVAQATVEVEVFNTKLTKVLDDSNTLMTDPNATFAACKTSVETLEKEQVKLQDLQKSLTADQQGARTAGQTAGNAVFEITKLLATVRMMWQKVTLQLNKTKPRMAALQVEAGIQEKEKKDEADFKKVIAKIKTDVTTVENTINAVAKTATPLIAKPPEDAEARDKKAEEIEKKATEAIKKLDDTKVELGEKMKGIQAYAPKARKEAQTALVEQQRKLMECMKSVGVYKTFKVNLPKLAKTVKCLTELTEKLNGFEKDITKSEALAKAATLTKIKVDNIDELLTPIQGALATALQDVIKAGVFGDAAVQEKITKQRTRADELKKKVVAVNEKIKDAKDTFASEAAIDTAKELLTQIEECWTKCQDAETPFLTGVEVLGDGVQEAATKACKDASTEAHEAMTNAKKHVTTNLAKAKKFEKELMLATVKELSALNTQIATLEGKVIKFQKEMKEREATAHLSVAQDAVEAHQAVATSAEAVGKALAAADLEDQSEEHIKQAIEKTKEARTEATKSSGEASKVVDKKQREANAGANHPALLAVKAGMQDGKQKINALTQLIGQAERLVKAKSALVTGEAAVKEAESAAKKAKKSVPKEGTKFTVESVAALKESCDAATKLISAAHAIVAPSTAGAPPKTKELLQKLIDRKTAAQTTITEIKASTKDGTEEATSQAYLAEAETQTKAAEEAMARLEEADSPFATGIELDLKATQELLAKCTTVAAEVAKASSEANLFIGKKQAEAKAMGEAAAKALKEGCEACAARVKVVFGKRQVHEKDMAQRTKDSKMTEAEAKVVHFETIQKDVLAKAEPFKAEGAAEMAEDKAEAPLKAFMEVADEYSKQKALLLTFLGQRQAEQKGNTDNTELLKKMRDRVVECQKAVDEAKKATAPHEKRSLGKRLIAEMIDLAASMQEELQKTTAVCSPFFETGGEDFLIDNSIRTLSAALAAHMREKELTPEAVFKSINKGKAVAEKVFVRYLTDLPTDIDHDELSAFSDERRAAIYKRLASAKGISQADFESLFWQEHICTKSTVVTDKFEVEGSETVCKVEPNTTVSLSAMTKETEGDAKTALTRSECKVGDKAGWITIKQGAGIKFFNPTSRHKELSLKLTKAVSEGMAAMSKATASIAASVKRCGNEEGPLKKAKEEIANLKEEIPVKAMNELKAKLATANSAFFAKEAAERTAHIEARNKKIAAPYLEGLEEQMAAVEAAAKAAEDAASPMQKLNGEELKAFASPATVLETLEGHASTLQEKAKLLREEITEKTKAVTEVAPQNGGTAEAKKVLKIMGSKVATASQKTSAAVNVVKNKCKTITDAKFATAGADIRKYASTHSKTPDEIFEELKKGDKIPEAAFCKLLENTDGPGLAPEIAKLVTRRLEADGVSLDKFKGYVVLYYKAVKTIAFTDVMDVNLCKTLRKIDEGEILEVLEGPLKDASGLERIRSKAEKDGKWVEGWVTVAGSKGTAFLVKTKKP